MWRPASFAALRVASRWVGVLVSANKFSDDVYMVRITKPEGIGDLMDDEGTLMEHGRFSFDSTQEVPKDTQLDVEVTPIE